MNQQNSSYVSQYPHFEKEFELVQRINNFRYSPLPIISSLISQLDYLDQEQQIKFLDLKKEIQINEQQTIQDFKNYLNLYINENFSSYIFDSAKNIEFIEKYKLDLQNENDILSQRFQNYATYKIKNVCFNNLDQLIMLLIVEEFLLLHSQQKQSPNLTIQHTAQHTQVGFLNNIYNSIYVYINCLEEETFDVFIVLLFDENCTVLGKTNNSMTQTHRRDRLNLSLIPSKYKEKIFKTTQIPRLSIFNLVELMDSNNDGKITVEDIKQFSHKNYLYFPENIYQEMFDDAAKTRRVTFDHQYKEPLAVNEIWMAVQLHYKINENHDWVENPKPYRKYWVTLLEKAGEKLPKKHDLPKIKIEPVFDLYQTKKSIETFHPQMSLQNSTFKITDFAKTSYNTQQRPEAGLIVGNKQYITEVQQQNQNEEQQKKQVEPFEKVVNIKFKQNDKSDYGMIDFDTKNYYSEAHRLSLNPQIYKKAVKNPILLYVPENFNFQASQIQQEEELKRQQQLLQQQQQTQKRFKNKIISQSQFKHCQTMKQSDTFYPYNVFDKNFYTRKYQVIQVVTKQQMEVDNNIFTTTFKLENCTSLKQKLAKQNNKTDPYKPSNMQITRDEFVQDKSKPGYITRFKCDPLPNRFGMSQHDSRPKEIIEKEQKVQQKLLEEQQRKINEELGKKQQKEWIKGFKLSDKLHNIGDGKKTEFISQGGIYYEPVQIQQSLLRQEDDFKVPFKLSHRGLRAYDKNMFLGQVHDSKF